MIFVAVAIQVFPHPNRSELLRTREVTRRGAVKLHCGGRIWALGGSYGKTTLKAASEAHSASTYLLRGKRWCDTGCFRKGSATLVNPLTGRTQRRFAAGRAVTSPSADPNNVRMDAARGCHCTGHCAVPRGAEVGTV